MTQETGYPLIDMEDAVASAFAAAGEHEDAPPLVDSGTESINDSPLTDDDSMQDSSAADHQPNSSCRSSGAKISISSLLDKSISVDEDTLIRPLEPEIVSRVNRMNLDGMRLLVLEQRPLFSILRRTSCYDGVQSEQDAQPRRVSFPTDKGILASYREPDQRPPFRLSTQMSSEQILQEYQNSCKRHNTIELDVIKSQITEIKRNTDRSAKLSLASVNVTIEVCETLEDLFHLVNFSVMNIKDSKFTSDSIREFINILEYYNCASEYLTTDHFKELEAWKMFCSMAAKSQCLESLTFERFEFSDSNVKMLLNNINSNESINVLKFSNCSLGMSPWHYLVDTLGNNRTLRELYLPQAELYTIEADFLGKLLVRNRYLKVLDISNNFIGDRGLEALAKGLCTQTTDSSGLSVLVIFNNQITEKSGPIISNIISECVNLHTLNIGFNNLTDEVVIKMEASLEKTKSLEGLGLQSTLLTDRGAIKLAESMQKNSSLKKINLKGNKAIQTDGLEKLSQALTNTKITKVELDESNRNCDDPQYFLELVKQVAALCTVNKSKAGTLDNEVGSWSTYFLRKVSLNCEPIYYQPCILTETGARPRKRSPAPSPVPSRGCSPQPRSRFSVSRVPDPPPAAPSPVSSRFKVVPVPTVTVEFGGGDAPPAGAPSPPPPDDDEELRQFANVRSSVSSIDSVDSLSTNRDSMYDSATLSGESD